MKSPLRRLALAALVLSGASAVSAAVIVWDTPVTISADTDVSTTGTLLKAFNLGDTLNSVTVNGVTFAAGPAANGTNTLTIGSGSGSLTMTDDLGTSKISGGTPFTENTAPFKDLSVDYKTLLKAANYVYPGGLTGTANISGLTIGQQYQVQFWVNDPRTSGIGRSQTFTAGNSVTFDYNTTDVVGGVGQFIIGTFTADGTNQLITTVASASYQLNAYQIRVIPEPATWALLLGSASLMVGLTKRRRA